MKINIYENKLFFAVKVKLVSIDRLKKRAVQESQDAHGKPAKYSALNTVSCN